VRLGDLGWELLTPSPLEPHLQMALDEVLLEEVAAGLRPPTLRFWTFSAPALVLGSNQVLANEVDAGAAAELGYVVARRMSGGGTMIVAPGSVVTYSLYAPELLVRGMSFIESYAFLDAWAVAGLRGIGVPASYRPINDIVSPEGKIAGAAQARRRRTVLHHTTMAYDLDPAIVPRLIRIGRPAVVARGVRSAEKVVTPIRRWTDLSPERVTRSLIATFGAEAPLTPGRVGPGTLDRARRLVETRYGRPDWIDRLSREP
jgi:lipoate-protein ligase A